MFWKYITCDIFSFLVLKRHENSNDSRMRSFLYIWVLGVEYCLVYVQFTLLSWEYGGKSFIFSAFFSDLVKNLLLSTFPAGSRLSDGGPACPPSWCISSSPAERTPPPGRPPSSGWSAWRCLSGRWTWNYIVSVLKGIDYKFLWKELM